MLNPDRRWDQDFLTIQTLLKNQTLGRIIDFESHFDRYKPSIAGSKPWKTRVEPGGGAIYDLGTHLIDQIVQLFGLPKKLTAFLGSQRLENDNPGSYDDACTVLMHYEGMMATVKVAVISPEVQQLRFWVRGEKGSYKKVIYIYMPPPTISMVSTVLTISTVPRRLPRRPPHRRHVSRRPGLRHRA